MYPAQGWVRGGQVASQDILEEINELRKKNFLLDEQLQEFMSENKFEISNLAQFNDQHEIELQYTIGTRDPNSHDWAPAYQNQKNIEKKFSKTWKDIFMLLADDFVYEKSEIIIRRSFAIALRKELHIKDGYQFLSQEVFKPSFDAILTQLMAYGLINSKVNIGEGRTRYLSWFLTDKGRKCMLENRAILQNSQ